MRNIFLILSVLFLAHAALAVAASSNDAAKSDPFRVTGAYADTDGEALYRYSCQSCHMDKGQGAKGAGMYPALAKNSNLQAPEYTVMILLNGLRGMPDFARTFNDEQIAAVTNYVITHFGNTSATQITAEQVKAMRP